MSIAERAKAIYERELKVQLEAEHFGRFLAIEPESGDYFPADTFIEAALAAKAAHPERKSFVLRVGHEAAFHIGASST